MTVFDRDRAGPDSETAGRERRSDAQVAALRAHIRAILRRLPAATPSAC